MRVAERTWTTPTTAIASNPPPTAIGAHFFNWIAGGGAFGWGVLVRCGGVSSGCICGWLKNVHAECINMPNVFVCTEQHI